MENKINCDKTICNSTIVNKPKPEWFTVNDENIKLKEFINLCGQLENCIEEMISNNNTNSSGFLLFKNDLSNIKNEVVVEAYNNDCFSWKF